MEETSQTAIILAELEAGKTITAWKRLTFAVHFAFPLLFTNCEIEVIT